MSDRSLKIKVENPQSPFYRVGNDIIELVDFTSCTLITNSMVTFKEYLEKEDPQGTRNEIFFDQLSVTALPSEIDRYSKTVAICKLETSKTLQTLKNLEGKNMDRDQFELFLRRLVRYGDDSVMDLFSWVKNFELKTVNSIQRKKDPDGSFRLFISREKAEKESYTPPEKLSFKVPLFKMVEKEIKLEFEFYFDYTNHEDKIATSFQILNVEMDEIIQEAQRKTIIEEIKALPNKKFCGELKIYIQDDNWKYQENKLD